MQFGVTDDPGQGQYRRARQHHGVAMGAGSSCVGDEEGAQHLFTVGPDGTSQVFARNARDERASLAPTFSEDGQTLLFNMADPGMTFAVSGLWDDESAPATSKQRPPSPGSAGPVILGGLPKNRYLGWPPVLNPDRTPPRSRNGPVLAAQLA